MELTLLVLQKYISLKVMADPCSISLKVVANLWTQIHGTLRINKPTVCSINSKWRKHMADEKHDLVYCRPNMKKTKDLHRLAIYWFITKPFLSKECMKYTMVQSLQENSNRRLKGSNGYLIHKPLQLHDLRVQLHHSLAPHIMWGAGSGG